MDSLNTFPPFTEENKKQYLESCNQVKEFSETIDRLGIKVPKLGLKTDNDGNFAGHSAVIEAIKPFSKTIDDDGTIKPFDDWDAIFKKPETFPPR